MSDIKPMWKHQVEGCQRAALLPGFAFFWEMGCGKSRALIETLRFRFNQQGRVLRTVIFCPPLVIENWRNEWRMYTKLDPKKIVLLHGAGKKRLQVFQKYSQDHNTLLPSDRIFITNYESLLMEPLFEAFEQWKPEVLVFDESHRCKSGTAKRSKLADKLANPWDQRAKKALPKPHCYLLSGSPILNSPMDVFQQYKIMDGGHSFGGNFFAFRARYFRDRNAGMPKDRYFPKWEIMTKARDGFDGEAEISELIFSKGMRVEKKDCLDLPPEVSIVMPVGMTPTQSRLYNEMKDDFVTYYESKACVATLAITKALRLMQITSGFVAAETPGEDERVIKSLPDTPKLALLKDLLEDICEDPKNKVLVWAVWKENYEHIKIVCKALGIGFVEVHGGVSEAAKRAAVLAFNSDPSVQLFLGHPGSGGIGINLTIAGYSIFYSRTFSLEHYLQARARNHRGGSKEAGHDKITHYDLVVENTIDEAVVKALANKQAISDKILRDLV